VKHMIREISVEKRACSDIPRAIMPRIVDYRLTSDSLHRISQTIITPKTTANNNEPLKKSNTAMPFNAPTTKAVVWTSVLFAVLGALFFVGGIVGAKHPNLLDTSWVFWSSAAFWLLALFGGVQALRQTATVRDWFRRLCGDVC